MVGTARFELATSRTPSVRATRLRYVPTGNLTTTRRNIERGRIAVASALTRLSPAFEKRQESMQRIAQIEQHFAAQQLRRTVRGAMGASARRFAGAVLIAKTAARAGNRESFIVEQALDAEDHVHILLAIEAAAAFALDGFEHGEFRFPVTQHKRFQVGQAADFADAIEALVRGGFCGRAVAGHSQFLPEGDAAIVAVCEGLL